MSGRDEERVGHAQLPQHVVDLLVEGVVILSGGDQRPVSVVDLLPVQAAEGRIEIALVHALPYGLEPAQIVALGGRLLPGGRECGRAQEQQSNQQ